MERFVTRIEWETGCAFCKYINHQRILYIHAQIDIPNRMYLLDDQMMSMETIIQHAVLKRYRSRYFMEC
jgi:hypothetical protein